MIHTLTDRLFGRHELRCPEDRPRARELLFGAEADDLRDTEVEHLHGCHAAGSPGEEDVLRLDVPVNYLMLVRDLEGVEHPAQHRDRLLASRMPSSPCNERET